MRHFLIILITWFSGITCYSQGAWNIGYVEIDSLDTRYLNTPIKLDFKHHWRKIKKPEQRSIRHYVTPEDTAYLLINNEKVTAIERRVIYVDHGSFNEQFLKIENHDKNVSRGIYDTEILQLEDNRIRVRALIRSYKVRNGKLKEVLESETVEFWVEKDKLDGVMIRI